MEELEKRNREVEYTEKDIQVLEGLEAVRVRPGMYIGSTSAVGLHHLVWEIVDNAIDEVHDGGCDHIIVTLFEDDSVQVEDNGRGIPTGINEKSGISTLETVFTVLHAGGKFGGNGGYKAAGGLHGVGASVVNALSIKYEAWDKHAGKEYYFACENGGQISQHIKEIGPATTTGTTVKFKPDPTIFKETTHFEYTIVRDRIRQLAFLNKGLKITLIDKRDNTTEEFCYEGGLREYIAFLNNTKEKVHEGVIYVEGAENNIEVEIAAQYNTTYNSTIYSYCNNINTPNGGTHEEGFNLAFSKIINKYAREKKLLKDNEDPLTKEDIREGLTAVISVKHENPEYEGQTKGKLGNSDIRPVVNKILSEQLETFLLENPKEAQAILNKIVLASKARISARKAREATRKSALGFTSLPGKLADCSRKDPTRSEIFIVEGDSAGGSAKEGRNREFQAILPLRGKILNVQKASENKIFDNAEINTMITAFGTSVGSEFDIEKLRYHKIIIMTDADVDGAHIAVLLLTFFYKFMRPLIEGGYVYIAQPPLYKAVQGKQTRYAYSEEEMMQIHKEWDPNGKINLQRYKGLGEMDKEQLWETTMDPETRVLKQVKVEDIIEADGVFEMLMGDEVEPRKEFIVSNAKFATNIDF